MTPPTVGLTMIVRNAEQTLPRMLGSLNDLADPKRSTIIDTGSDDGTIELLRDWGAKPVSRKWKNFQHNRSALMARARGKADYLLLLDADMELSWRHDQIVWSHDVIHARLAYRSLDYALPFLVVGNRMWEYKGYAHSYLSGDGDPVTQGETDAFFILDHSTPSEAKIRRDLELLWQELRDTDFDNPRAWYYLAQTYRDLDRPFDAIAMYFMRSKMGGGFEEERWHALYQAGSLAVEHQSFQIGAELLLESYKQRPHRAEPLRALANSANSVADKIPYPTQDRLFVYRPHYKTPAPALSVPVVVPPFPDIAPERAPGWSVVKIRDGKLGRKLVTAIVVTRGNVDLGPVVDPLVDYFDDVIVWDNSRVDPKWHGVPVEFARERGARIIGGADFKAFGRYAAIPCARNPVIYWQDDDVIFTDYERLLAAYKGGRLVCNMDDAWIDGAGYRGTCGMQGAGSLCDSWLPATIWDRYLERYPWDDDALVECDFVFGTLVPFTVVDLGYDTQPFADDPDRLYVQPGQTERKHMMIQRCLTILSGK